MSGKEPFHGRAPIGQRDPRNRLNERHDPDCGCRTCRRLRRRDALRRAKHLGSDDEPEHGQSCCMNGPGKEG